MLINLWSSIASVKQQGENVSLVNAGYRNESDNKVLFLPLVYTILKYLLLTECAVRTVSYRPSSFPCRMAHFSVKRARHKKRGKNAI